MLPILKKVLRLTQCFCIKSIAITGVGRKGEGRGLSTLDFENWHFLINFLAKKGCFSFQWMKWKFATFGTHPEKSFLATTGKSASGPSLGKKLPTPMVAIQITNALKPWKYCSIWGGRFPIRIMKGLLSPTRNHSMTCADVCAQRSVTWQGSDVVLPWATFRATVAETNLL